MSGSSREILFMRFVRILPIAASLLAGCAAPRASAPEASPAPVSAAGLPAPVILEPKLADPSLLAVLRVQDPILVLQRLGFGPDALNKKFPGFDARDLHPGTLAVFAFRPLPGHGEAPSLMGLVPAATETSLVTRANAQAVHIEPLGRDSVWLPNTELLSERMRQASAFREQAQAPMPDDVAVDLDVASLLVRYREPLLSSLKRTAHESKEFGPALMQFWEQWLKDVEAVSTARLSARFLAENYDLSLVWRRKAQPAAVSEDPGVSPGLMQFLPEGQFRVQETGRFGSQSVDLVQSMMSGLAGNDANLSEMFNQDLAEQARLTSDGQMAFSGSFSATRGMHFVTLVATRNAEALVEHATRTATRLSDPVLRDRFRRKGVNCSSAVQTGAESIAGFSVNHVEIDCTFDGRSSDLATKLVRRIYPMGLDIVRVGNYVVTDVNGTREGLRRIVLQLADGRPSGKVLAAVGAFPQKAGLFADFDIAGLLKELAWSETAQLDTAMPGPVPPVLFAAVEQGALTQYRVRLPRSVLAALRNLAPREQQRAPAPK
jgi:hypothetical protein